MPASIQRFKAAVVEMFTRRHAANDVFYFREHFDFADFLRLVHSAFAPLGGPVEGNGRPESIAQVTMR